MARPRAGLDLGLWGMLGHWHPVFLLQNDLVARQSNGTAQTLQAMLHFLNYAATNPDAKKTHKASDVILSADSDAAHLVAPQARSRAGGFHCLGNKDGNLMSGSVAVVAKIIKNVVASAAEAEAGALLMSAQLAAPMRTTPEELGHPQPPAPMKTDNTAANGVISGTAKQQRSKAIDMRFHWLKDRVEQGQFKICWEPGDESWADCFAKHHPPTHRRKARPAHLKEQSSPGDLQGCLELIKGHQPAGTKVGANGQTQGLSPEARLALEGILRARPAAPQA